VAQPARRLAGRRPAAAARPAPRGALNARWLRLAAVAALVAAALIIGRATGLDDALSRDALREAVGRAGVWGAPLYVGAFALGLLLHVPAAGIAFVAVAVAAYDRVGGGILAYAGAVTGVLVSFAVVRAVGGRPLAGLEHRLARKVMARLEARPLLTVIVLRTLFFAGAPVNYALALSPLRARDYVVGSALGMVGPVATLALFFDLLLA
jgi:uncharacterized membrane protein YdjX (TVP38/TMEM64 family)